MRDKKYEFDQLVLEVTRRCNMQCDHCLRGEEEGLDMTPEWIDYILDSTSSIHDLTITGGEPMLVPELIIHLLDQIMSRNISVDSFFMATNGTIFDKDLFFKLIEFYWYVDPYEDFGFSVAVSQDQYHFGPDHDTLAKWKSMKFYSNSKEGEIPYRGLIDEGMANENGIGDRILRIPKGKCIGHEEDETIFIEEMCYINAKGEVVRDCDMSYKTQEDHVVGTIFNDDFYVLEDEDGRTSEPPF